MPTTTISELRDALGLGLSTITRLWSYRTKDWVTSVFAADIDSDGTVEVIACSRDGRVHMLTMNGLDRFGRWERVVGTKAWVGAVAVSGFSTQGESRQARIVVGTRDGKVYLLDKDGCTLTREGEVLPFGSDGKVLDREKEHGAYWLNTGYVIRQLCINPEQPTTVIIGSEDRCAYALSLTTGEVSWKFSTNGWVRAIYSYDINGDGKAEICIGSTDKYLYALDSQGNLLEKHNMKYPVRTIYASDVDQDGQAEILVGTNGKELVALKYTAAGFTEKWHHPFDNRLLSLYVTDIDNDGKKEIIAGSEDKHFYILDDQGRVLWRHYHGYRVFSVYPYDIDNDGFPELLLGSDNNLVRAMRIRLHKGLEGRIRRYYGKLDSPDLANIPTLNAEERELLQNIVGVPRKASVSMEQAKNLLNAEKYTDAISVLLQLGHQKVQRLWYKGKIGSSRTISLRHITSGAKREIIVGTSEGHVLAYHASGRLLWSMHLNDHIVDVQTGYIDQHKQEEIVICSSEHHVYILSGTSKPRVAYINTWMSSICVTTPNRQSGADIIIGSEDRKLYIYDSDLSEPRITIPTDEGIRVVRTYTANEDNMPEIIAATIGSRIYAYARNGQCLWEYEVLDHIRDMRIKDINGDGKIEVLIGSEDRNLHVLNSAGQLLWRYYLPHSVLSVDAMDADMDGKVEVFVGCADGYLYVLSRDGDLLWKYQARDRIHAVRIEDIDDDGNLEIMLSSEDELEVLQMVNQHRVRTQIEQCWTALCRQQPVRQILEVLLKQTDPFLQAFALNKFAESERLSWQDFDLFDSLIKSDAVEVRKALVRTITMHYQDYAVKSHHMLQQLSADTNAEVRDTFIDCLPMLMMKDWDTSYQYLRRFSENSDRYVRRSVVRILHRMIDLIGTKLSFNRDVFELLLAAAHDKESEWVRQEAARTLAYFLDLHQGGLIIYVHLLIVKGIQQRILQHIAHNSVTPVVKYYLYAVINIQTDLNNENALARTQQVVRALEEAVNLAYGSDILTIYQELSRLLAIKTLDDFAEYTYSLNLNQFSSNNEFARIILEVFGKLNSIIRMIKIFLKREGSQDRLTILLETSAAIEKAGKFLERQYALPLLGEPLTRLPDRIVFTIILQCWNEMVQEQINLLRGKAEIEAELQTKITRYEDQVGIWLRVGNTGRNLANNVIVTLLHNEHFTAVGQNTFETDTILAGENVTAEFILQPSSTSLNLQFEIVYDDVEDEMKTVAFGDRLELQESTQEFHYIENPYSTGTPTQDSKMFYGREEDMAFLRENLTRNAKSVVVLYGQRRSGKTTLLLQFINTAVSDAYIPVMIDMQRHSYHLTIQNFLYRVAHTIAREVQKHALPLCMPQEMLFEKDPMHAFDLFLDNIEEQLKHRKLVLLIDEFEVLEEQVMKQRLEPEIFSYLRSIVQHRRNINFLFSGTHKITEHTKWYRSTFFNIALHHHLSRLSPQAAENLIRQPVAGYLEYEPLTVKKIRQLTADQPYLIHLICRSLIDYCNEQRKTYVTINDVNEVLRAVMLTGQFHFDWLWDQVSPEERVLLSALAEGGKEEGRWLTLIDLEEVYRRNRISYKREYLIANLKSLLDADLIEIDMLDNTLDSNRFKIPIGLIRGWLLKERSLHIVRKELNG